jgi:hypothetical protein
VLRAERKNTRSVKGKNSYVGKKKKGEALAKTGQTLSKKDKNQTGSGEGQTKKSG